jgi:hypothetical protein
VIWDALILDYAEHGSGCGVVVALPEKVDVVIHRPAVIAVLELDPAVAGLDIVIHDPDAAWYGVRRRPSVRGGIDISESNVIVTSGAHLGVVACLSVLAQPGEAVMAENLNYASLGSLISGLNLKAVPLEMHCQIVLRCLKTCHQEDAQGMFSTLSFPFIIIVAVLKYYVRKSHKNLLTKCRFMKTFVESNF